MQDLLPDGLHNASTFCAYAALNANTSMTVRMP